MTDPFAPPRANLDVPEDRGPRPASVRIATWLLGVSIALKLAWIAGVWGAIIPVPLPAESRWVVMASALVGAGLVCFLAWKIYLGRNWARWTFTVWIAFGILSQGLSLAFNPAAWSAAGPIALGASFVQMVLNVAIIALLLVPRDARYWFGVRPVPSS